MNKMKIILVLLLYVLLTGFESPKKDSLQRSEKNRSENLDSSVVTYKMLYENQKEVNNSILQTVYWSLGSMLSIILLVIGSSIYFNFKFNRKEVELTLAELLRSLEDAKSGFLAEINTRVNDEASELKRNIDVDKQQLHSTYSELIKSYSDNLNQLINSNKNSTEEKMTLLSDQIKNTTKDIKSLDSKIKSNFKHVQRDLYSNEASVYLIKEYFNSALDSYLKLAILDFEVEYRWNFKFIYPEIITCLQKVEFIYNDDAERIVKLTEVAKEYYPAEAVALEKLANSKEKRQLKHDKE